EGAACGATGRELGEIRRAQADAHRWEGRGKESAAASAEAMELLEAGSVAWCKAAETCAAASLAEVLSEAELARLVEVLLEVEARPGAEVALCGALCMFARSMFLLSRFDDGRRVFAKIEPLVESLGGKERGVVALFANLRAV